MQKKTFGKWVFHVKTTWKMVDSNLVNVNDTFPPVPNAANPMD